MQIGTSTQGKSNQSKKYTGDGPIIGDSNTGDQEENRKRNQVQEKVGDENAPGAETEDGPMGASFREVDPV